MAPDRKIVLEARHDNKEALIARGSALFTDQSEEHEAELLPLALEGKICSIATIRTVHPNQGAPKHA